MSTYEPDQLLQLWKQDKIDTEMAIGHLLQNLVTQQQTLKKMNSLLLRFQLDLENLLNQVQSLSGSSGAPRSGM